MNEQEIKEQIKKLQVELKKVQKANKEEEKKENNKEEEKKEDKKKNKSRKKNKVKVDNNNEQINEQIEQNEEIKNEIQTKKKKKLKFKEEDLKNIKNILTDIKTEHEFTFSQPKKFNGLMSVYFFESDINFKIDNAWKGNTGNRKIEDIYLIDKYKNDFKTIVENALKYKSVKINISIRAKYKRVGVKEIKYLYEQIFHTTTQYKIIFNSTDINEVFENFKQYLIEKINNFEGQSSNLLLVGITEFYINVIKYDPLGVGSYIKLPPILSNKKCL